MSSNTNLRHDEQQDEAYYDDRLYADDDLQKGRIRFSTSRLYGRQEPLDTLQTVWNRLPLAGQVVVVGGYAGTGKSTLIQTFLNAQQDNDENNVIVWHGKYAERQDTADPFSAIVQAITKWLLQHQDDKVLDVADATVRTLDAQELQILCHVVGDLERFTAAFANTNSHNNNTNQSRLHDSWSGASSSNSSNPNNKHHHHPEGPPPAAAAAASTTTTKRRFSSFLPSTNHSHNNNSGTTNSLLPSALLPPRIRRASQATIHVPKVHFAIPPSSSSSRSFSVSNDSADSASQDEGTTTSTAKFNHVFAKFVGGILQHLPHCKLVLWLDDLQWADAASLELLQVLWRNNNTANTATSTSSSDAWASASSPSLLGNTNNNNNNGLPLPSNHRRMLCIGSYRSHQVHDDHPLIANLFHECEQQQQSSSSNFTKMELQDLSIEDLTEFVADSLQRTPEEVTPLVQAVHAKTMGNVFFTMQALEELVRKNVLFYDVMVFSWQWKMDPHHLEGLLSENVLDMVRSKIKSLPKSWQWTVVVAAHLRTTFDLALLRVVLTKTMPRPISSATLSRILDQIVLQGLLSNPMGTTEYTFTHDRIQEVASSLVTHGALYELQFQIAHVLEGMRQEEWMLYTAVHYLNGLPVEFLQSKSQWYDRVDLAKLNLETARHALRANAFGQASHSLRAARDWLGRDLAWTKRQYSLTLEIYHRLLQTEFALGNWDEADQAIHQVLKHAKHLEEKTTAHVYSIQVIVNRPSRDYELAVTKAIDIFHQMGLPHVCRNPSDARVLKEHMKMKLALGGRQYTDLLQKLDESQHLFFRQLEQLCRNSIYVNDLKLGMMACYIALQKASQDGLSASTLPILPLFALIFRIRGQLRQAMKVARFTLELSRKHPHYRGAQACRGNVTLYACVIQMYEPFQESLELMMQMYGDGIPNNEVEFSFTAAMIFGISYFASGVPMTGFLEPKLIMFEEGSRQLKQPPSVAITFSIFRQTFLNLQGRLGNGEPTRLDGSCFSEEKALSQFTGSQQKQTFRDISTYRLLLAVIYNDETTMDEMLHRLDSYPEFDFVFARSHLRFLFSGLAASYLMHEERSGEKASFYKKAFHQSLCFFHKYAKLKSKNAIPVVKCLKAEQHPSLKAYAAAIQACRGQDWFHLEALMNERLGRWLLSSQPKTALTSNVDVAESVLVQALWLYNDWGAFGKCQALRKEFEFVKDARRPESSHRAHVFVPKLIENMSSTAGGGSIMDETGSHHSGQSSVSGL